MYIAFGQYYMNKCAQFQSQDPGAFARLKGDHCYDWEGVRSNGQTFSLNLQEYSNAVFGQKWLVVNTNMGSDGWWFWNPDDPRNEYTLQLVVVMSSEWARKIPETNSALGRYENNARYSLKWLKDTLGKTFKLQSRTQIVIVPESSEQILNIARSTSDPNKRFDFLYWASQKYENRYKFTNKKVMYVMATFTGDHPLEDFGSAAAERFAVLSSDNTSVRIDPNNMTEKMENVAWDFMHETLHGACGMKHPDESHGPLFSRSIMHRGYPPWAILLPHERALLDVHPFMKLDT